MYSKEFILESPRLGFRLMAITDFESLKTLDMDPEVRAHFPDGISSPGQTRERIERNRINFEEKGYCDFTVVHKDSGRFAGRSGFGDIVGGEIEAGYVFMEDFWGIGLAQEALTALLGWAERNVIAERILAYAPITHSASINVMVKCGMRHLKTESTHGVDCIYYSHPLSEFRR
jgi:ribosomal-protein-alanine N-acetyltransferase